MPTETKIEPVVALRKLFDIGAAVQYLRAIGANLAHDDFYSSCKRLEGFGLVIELPRNPTRIAPGDYSFRPTRRGEKLIRLLSDTLPSS